MRTLFTILLVCSSALAGKTDKHILSPFFTLRGDEVTLYRVDEAGMTTLFTRVHAEKRDGATVYNAPSNQGVIALWHTIVVEADGRMYATSTFDDGCVFTLPVRAAQSIDIGQGLMTGEHYFVDQRNPISMTGACARTE